MRHTRFFLIFAAAIVGCNSDTGAGGMQGDGGTDGGNQTNTDGGGLSCGAIGQVCSAASTCCSGFCDTPSQTCAFPASICAAQGASCSAPTDCCNLTCASGKCGAACKANGQGCSAGTDCCSQSCSGGTCQALTSTTTCTTLGNTCTQGSSCCSGNCQGGLCTTTGVGCNANGDICTKAGDCCSGICTIATGASAGTCSPVTAPGSGGCMVDGEPCGDCTNCCSRTCIPTATGAHVCAPASGCRLDGDTCKKDGDCCAGKCDIVSGSNPPIGTCHNHTSCDPDGDVCGGASGNQCGNTEHDCCGCHAVGGNPDACCHTDFNGIPRCSGGGSKQCPNGYVSTDPNCCIKAGDQCAFSAECCGGTPCVPDGNGVFRCGSQCVNQTGACTTTSDCCVGLMCNVPMGATTGTCGSEVPPPSAPVDMAGSPPVDMAGSSGGGDMAMVCALLGQPCTSTPCCGGYTCSSTTNTCEVQIQ